MELNYQKGKKGKITESHVGYTCMRALPQNLHLHDKVLLSKCLHAKMYNNNSFKLKMCCLCIWYIQNKLSLLDTYLTMWRSLYTRAVKKIVIIILSPFPNSFHKDKIFTLCTSILMQAMLLVIYSHIHKYKSSFTSVQHVTFCNYRQILLKRCLIEDTFNIIHAKRM